MKSIDVNYMLEMLEISLPAFLQIIEMDVVSCTVSVQDSHGKKKGSLFFTEGKLVDAEYGDSCGLESAYKLCAFNSSSFSIDPPVDRPVRINAPLSHVLLNATDLTDHKQEEPRTTEDNSPITLQNLIDFLNATKGVVSYILVNWQGKTIFQSKRERQAGKTGSLEKNHSEKGYAGFLAHCAESLINLKTASDQGLESCIVELDDEKAALSVFYQDMVLSLLLANKEIAQSIVLFLDKEKNDNSSFRNA